MRSYPHIKRRFNHFVITFGPGQKKPGDYVVFVNSKQVSDEDIFKVLATKIMSQESAIKFLKFLWEIGKIEHQGEEEQIFNRISASNFNAEMKTSLYVIWHRLIIDDINYPPPLNGRKRSLGQVYILLAKKWNFDLPNEVKSISKEVYLLGFPKGVEEKIETKTWPKIYELYKKFVTGGKTADDYIKAGL